MAGNETYYYIPAERREFIRTWLKASDCSPAMGGYHVLYHVISIAADHPEYSCQQLFEEYAFHVSGGKDINWRTAYNLARYCFNNAVSSARSLYAFIREASIDLAEWEEEERKEDTDYMLERRGA